MMGIPCETCIVRPVCRKPKYIGVTCMHLFDCLIYNEDGDIISKLEKLEEVFKIAPCNKRIVNNISQWSIIVYRESQYNRFLYSIEDKKRKVIEITNYFRPNIHELMRIDEQKWGKLFTKGWHGDYK